VNPLWRTTLAAGIGTAACDDTTTSTGAPAPVTTRAGAQSPLACGHWANIRRDINDGVLTDAEAREKIGQVEDSATDDRVRAAARQLRAAITSGTHADIAAGLAALDRACGT
jgi:hypothetical protein